MKLKHKIHSMNDDAAGASVNPDDEKTTSSASPARSFLFLEDTNLRIKDIESDLSIPEGDSLTTRHRGTYEQSPTVQNRRARNEQQR